MRPPAKTALRPATRTVTPPRPERNAVFAHFVNMLPDLPARLSWVTQTGRIAIDLNPDLLPEIHLDPTPAPAAA